MDGVDAVLAAFEERVPDLHVRTLASIHLPFPAELLAQLHALQAAGDNELHREALAANALGRLYADAVAAVLERAGVESRAVRAIGAHGQTIRHRPEHGYTRQIGNPALVAELTGIDVIADLRSRDIAAGGQGAPLVPAFHQAIFGKPGETRVVANIGGIANISVLHADGRVTGFDTGPGNVLLDTWCMRHLSQPFDTNGTWSASGRVVPELLQGLLREPYLQLPPPKSTGRDLFHTGWLDRHLAVFANVAPADVQATLAAFTAQTLATAIARHALDAQGVYVCGGGAYNGHLMHELARQLQSHGLATALQTTEALGAAPNQVEALAFAWLALRHLERQPGNIASVTGAQGPRILGAHYPA